MKKVLFTLLTVVSYLPYSFSQTNTFPTTGNAGAGTTAPTTLLQVSSSGATLDDVSSINPSNLSILAMTGGRSSTMGSELEFSIPSTTAPVTSYWGQGRIITVAANGSTNNATGEMVLGTRRYFNKLGTGNNWYYGNDLVIDGSGNVGIGTPMTTGTSGYKFAVAGSAVAVSMTVKLQANWPDYVFKKDFHLPPLSEVKYYISQNQHLPELPSAQDVEKNGLDLGEMNKLLVKKVEELTLYLIEKESKEREDEVRLNRLENEVKVLSNKQRKKSNRKSLYHK